MIFFTQTKLGVDSITKVYWHATQWQLIPNLNNIRIKGLSPSEESKKEEEAMRSFLMVMIDDEREP